MWRLADTCSAGGKVFEDGLTGRRSLMCNWTYHQEHDSARLQRDLVQYIRACNICVWYLQVVGYLRVRPMTKCMLDSRTVHQAAGRAGFPSHIPHFHFYLQSIVRPSLSVAAPRLSAWTERHGSSGRRPFLICRTVIANCPGSATAGLARNPSLLQTTCYFAAARRA